MSQQPRASQWRRLAAAAVLLGLAQASSLQAATITINNTDATGVGLNDTTAFTPVGGNTATTLGQARLNVLKQAASIWGARLVSGPTIVVDASFASLGSSYCTSRSGTLALTGPAYVFVGFSGAPNPNAYYAVAEANALSGRDLGNGAEISADFNGAVDSDPNCLGGVGFYYGLDNQAGSQIDLLNVAAHEFAHGLGFISLVDLTTGSGPNTASPNELGIYDQYVYDESLARYWPSLSSSQRLSSAKNSGQLTFNATATNSAAGTLSAGANNGHVKLYAPSTISSGSSVSHWDSSATPNLLLEAFITSSVAVTGGTDLTSCALKDIGWTLASGIGCPDSNSSSPPSVSLIQSSSSITLGQSVTLSWNATNASSCTASGAWSGTRATSGSEAQTPGATGSYTYVLSCSNGTGSATASATVQVTPVVPTISFSISPTTITLGNSATATWSSSNASSCTASGDWSGTLPTAGSLTLNPAQAGTYSYVLSCANGSASASATASLTVQAPSVSVSVAISPSSITLGGSASLSWTSTNASSCQASGAWSGSQATSGTLSVTPAQTGSAVYTLNCSNSGSSGTAQATLTVNAAPTGGSGGGGGAVPPILLAVLAALAWRRRR